MSWTEHIIHFVDFEGAAGCGILEFGVVTARGSDILDTVTRRCAPTGWVRAADVAMHGLGERELAGAAPFVGEFERFAVLRETGPLAAHFAGAEQGMIKSVWPYPRRSPDFARGGSEGVVEWGPWIDTGRLYPQFYPGLVSAKLGDLVAVFGLQARLDEAAARWCPPERRRYHAALYDALAGALLLTRLAEEPTLRERSVGWLIAMSTLDGARRDDLRQGEMF